MFKTNLEQWALLRAIVEHGSIAKAAEQHFRSQPAVSYQLNQLQDKLGFPLLELKGRKLELTQSGQVLLEQASVLLDNWQLLEEKAIAVKNGERTVISLVVDSLFPKSCLFDAFEQFHQRFPHTHIHLKETVRDEGIVHIHQQEDELYVISLSQDIALPKEKMLDVPVMLVAHRDHPIFSYREELRAMKLADYPTIQVVDKHHQQGERPTHYQESWYFTSITSAVAAITNKLGCGWLPASEIQQQLSDQTLRPITEHESYRRITSIYAVKNPKVEHDACIQALAELLKTAVSSRQQKM
ncbi:LysR family transcriptional regulator [Vibrio furnissii]|uniref:LysR family transcriptional regulator n=1 Tax=Vibrio furnissii TaxID=29494 RepID=A0A0Q2SF89_VIBFU|nr:LysR family transcriptional regulator [Vibrio furnissii]KQH86211.1 LysR family transcriptional regulator [Vibrio furnissii]